MIVHQNSYVTFEYDQIKKRLTQTWKGMSPSETFREAIDKLVEFASETQVKTIISNTLNQAVVKPADTEYAAAVMPQLFAKGLKAMAFVIPENIFNQLSLKKFADNKKTSGVQYFKSIADAASWLDSK